MILSYCMTIIDILQKEGFEFVTADELLLD